MFNIIICDNDNIIHATDTGWLPLHDTTTIYDSKKHTQYGNMGQEGLNSSVPLTQTIYENY